MVIDFQTTYFNVPESSLYCSSMEDENWSAVTLQNNSVEYIDVERSFYESMDNQFDQVVQV